MFTPASTQFAALYAKLKRINLIFHNPNKYKRVKITEKDVMKPYLLLMLLNIITLACWTAMAPLTYQRFDYPGTGKTFRSCVKYASFSILALIHALCWAKTIGIVSLLRMVSIYSIRELPLMINWKYLSWLTFVCINRNMHH